MKTPFRLSTHTFKVLDEFLSQPMEWQHGYQLSRATKIKSGTLYPILMRLAEHKWLETRWEAAEPGTPPRHLYRLTPEGLEQARAKFKELEPLRLSRRAALSVG